MRLGEILVEDGSITTEQLREALERQVLLGGRLGSNLVQLQFISVEHLALALGRQHHMPAALEAHFDHLVPELLEKLSAMQAATWHALPLGRTGPNGTLIAIATPDPVPPEVAAKLKTCFASELVFAICPELRMLYWLEEIYKITRTNRFKRLPRPKTDPPPAHTKNTERRGYVQTLSEEDPPTGTSQLARVAVKRISVPISGEIEMPIDLLSFEESIRVIRQSNGRRKLASSVTHLLKNGFEGSLSAGMLFTIRGPLAVGWQGFARHRETDDIEALAIPLLQSSLFRDSYEKKISVCSSPSSLSPAPNIVDTRFWEFLGPPPEHFAVLPIIVMDKLVAFLYCQGSQDCSGEHQSQLQEIAGAVAAAIARLIRAASR